MLGIPPQPCLPSNCLFGAPRNSPGLSSRCSQRQASANLRRRRLRELQLDNWAGAILRAETTVTPNAPFSSNTAGDPTDIVKRPVWKTVLAVDRPTYLIPGLDSMTIGAQSLKLIRRRKGRFDGRRRGQSGQQRQIFSRSSFSSLFQKGVSLEFFGFFDTDDAHWLQPGVHWEVGNNVRLDLYYNKFGGAEKRRSDSVVT